MRVPYNARPDGWSMTHAQRNLYFNYWQQIVKLKGWTAAEAEAQRKDYHERAGLGRCSAKEIDKLHGFDAIKAVFLAELNPASVEDQLAQLNQPRTRALYVIAQLEADLAEHIEHVAPYVNAILRDRFGGVAKGDLSLEQLEQLRKTLVRCIAGKRKKLQSTFDGECGPSSEGKPERPF